MKEDQDLEAGENGRPKKQSGRVPRIQVRPSAKRRDDTNSIEAVRRARFRRSSVSQRAREAEPAVREAAGSNSQSADGASEKSGNSDPWTVPQSVRDRFVQDRRQFFFPDGVIAFKDHGRKLSTSSENTKVIESLIEIAHSRGWSEVTVRGTERFRGEAWRQARLNGLAVRGYQATEAEQRVLVRTLGRRESAGASVVVDTEESRPPPAPDSHHQDAGQSSRASPVRSDAETDIVGRLLDHGRDTYRHKTGEAPSYFVRLQTRDGLREIWGKDLERAMTRSLSQPNIGDEITLRTTGRDPVEVRRTVRNSAGQQDSTVVDAYRNRWVIEKTQFLMERATAAQVVRNDSIDPKTAVRAQPQLAGTYVTLRAAELAAEAIRDPLDRRRFVSQVRGALADAIERGEPLSPVRLNETTKTRRDKAIEVAPPAR
jgi:putative DNA primase/helicase